MNHDNINIIKELGRRTKGGNICLVAPGDYICTPAELERTGLLDALGLAVVPTNRATCNTKCAREIDYVLVTRNFATIIKSVELITTGPWPTHYGIRVRLKADPHPSHLHRPPQTTRDRGNDQMDQEERQTRRTRINQSGRRPNNS